MESRRFDTIEEIQEESQQVLDTVPKRTSREASKHGRNPGTAVFVQKGSTLKVMDEFNIQVKQTSFYKYCPGTFGYALVVWMFLKNHSTLFLTVQHSIGGLAKLLDGACPNCLKILMKFFHVPIGIWKKKI